ncbi:hypothetical protein CPAST_c12260 [Clostridium pasteurianum DSM 525 = ATCC 6013]|uniref:Sporulation protein YyaC n=1 Tax=Clostridium pasteurianum DSM 525 = ATCC 6013 TaxID=1262449 RepID=A0A0H3J0F8_CLOPA|nr:spore protease YyaC [Clostridium pasteurianum]AJA47326.1 hypothetical protein CPAST_c12260 [Clostridium pasteurianum DSM 525 = ATCC 6013]AJA51314.1 hypothetical protein CLPA_c12260 [Clostridium pasteurianum DSM 525 = ATCC 6013]ELP58663.1 hypothetical protein F502_12808 [Clostridium pasteurianum DSM 525 = ATCC 6013]KRU12678.1 sporulation protein YyaC [Clostridium pasteurianum DSM 525 = ATCC 6013]UZW15500.1 spore protease YyaC [Clostridium pasteurianum]
MEIYYGEKDAHKRISEEIDKRIVDKNNIVILCIGTDRSTGDSLGPLVGTFLKGIDNVYGTLENPIHAKNLSKSIKNIKLIYDNPYIIVIDACLGNAKDVGKIIVKDSPIVPGVALNKKLQAVGDLSIIGVVNVIDDKEFMVLQNTRLNTVYNMAQVISKSIIAASL